LTAGSVPSVGRYFNINLFRNVYFEFLSLV